MSVKQFSSETKVHKILVGFLFPSPRVRSLKGTVCTDSDVMLIYVTYAVSKATYDTFMCRYQNAVHDHDIKIRNGKVSIRAYDTYHNKSKLWSRRN